MQFIIYLIFIFFVYLFWLIPFSLLYVISDFFYFLLYYVAGYRKKVVYDNLKRAFPDKTDKEITILASKFFRNLTDVILEGIKGFSMSNKQLIKRFKIVNPEKLNELYKSNKSYIAVCGHYANWEWGSISGGLQIDMNIVVFYKPLSNKYIDKYLKNHREHAKTYLASIAKTNYSFKEYIDKKSIFTMVGDQSPSNVKFAYWLKFLNQPTAWIHGPEKYAKHYNLPIIFLDVQRLKRGYYTFKVTNLIDNPNDYKESEITRIYADKLESIIIDKPEFWLWSHKRWKIKAPENISLHLLF